jgi:formate/nitrite transporter
MSFKSPKEIVDAVTANGTNKAKLTWSKLLLLGFLAGMYIAFGGLLAIMVGSGVPGIKATDPGLQKFIFGAVFPVGLVLVVIAGAELFTGNTALIIPPLLSRKISIKDTLKNWGGSYLGNLIGAVCLAYFFTYLTDLLATSPWLESTRAIAEAKVNQSFGVLLLKGIACNILVCLAVWMAVASDDIMSKIIAIWFPIMTFVTLGFEHSIANMFFIPTGIFYGAQVSWSQFFITNLLPVTIGNIIGGSLFVGALYWYVYAAPQEKG